MSNKAVNAVIAVIAIAIGGSYLPMIFRIIPEWVFILVSVVVAVGTPAIISFMGRIFK